MSCLFTYKQVHYVAEMETSRVDRRWLPVGSCYPSDRVDIRWPVRDQLAA